MRDTWHEVATHVLRAASPAGPFEACQAGPAAPGRPAIVVLLEVFGVDADLRTTFDELAAAGFLAICPELFWRQENRVDPSVRDDSGWQKGSALRRAFYINASVRGVEATVVVARTRMDPEAIRTSHARTLEFFNRSLA